MESRKTASKAVGRSVSSPSTPRDLWCVRWYGYTQLARCPTYENDEKTYAERCTIWNSNWQVGKDSQ